MITLVQPWALSGLVAVALAGLWAVFRPGRAVVVVAALCLWRRAADSLSRSARRPTRRVSASWALLLAGAAAAVLAAARPVLFSAAPARRVAVALHPGAELGAGGGEIWRPAAALLDRLAERDRVRLILPALSQASEIWLTPEQARRELRFVRPVPAPARELTVPPGPRGAQHVYHFVPAGAGVGIARGPAVTVIELPTRLPAATLEALGAEPLAGERTQVFFAVRNHSRAPWRGRVRVSGRAARETAMVVGPGGRAEVVRRIGRAEQVGVELLDESGRPLSGFATSGWLVRRAGQVRKVAMIGRDEPLIRRFVKADPLLRLVGRPGGADLVIANGISPPGGKPALVINAPAAPAGWRRGEARGPVLLGAAVVARDDPVMRDVSLDGVAVRAVEPFVRLAGGASQKQLCGYEGGALILRSGGGRAARRRRIHVAFDLNEQNTNFAMHGAFVVLLANSARWLSPGMDAGPPRFESRSPLDAQGLPWLPAGGAAAGSVLGIRPDPLPRPGVYRGPAGQPYAVSLLGLRAGQPDVPPVAAAAAAPLPAPVSRGEGSECWWMLLAAAMAFWLAGWALRTR